MLIISNCFAGIELTAKFSHWNVDMRTYCMQDVRLAIIPILSDRSLLLPPPPKSSRGGPDTIRCNVMDDVWTVWTTAEYSQTPAIKSNFNEHVEGCTGA
jgi:hypothetical protein